MVNALGRLYTIGYTALQARQAEIEALTDNLANLNTPAFKQKRLAFQATLSAENDKLLRRGVELSAATPDFSQGPVQVTGEMWDLAIDGPGMFRLQLPAGRIGYSRLGTFRLDGQGHLINEQGLYLVPPVTIPPGVEAVAIDARGVITVTEGGASRVLARLQLARFPNPEGLIDQGNGVYLPSTASGEPVVAAPTENGMGQIIAGALEMANVDAAQQMVNLLRVQRSYALTLRALQISDQMYTLTTQLQG
jgi:flagellar basal-body rod protein FlgG